MTLSKRLTCINTADTSHLADYAKSFGHELDAMADGDRHRQADVAGEPF
jgi:hypothetical protein